MGYLTRVPSALTAFASNSLKFRAANAKYINHLKVRVLHTHMRAHTQGRT